VTQVAQGVGRDGQAGNYDVLFNDEGARYDQ